MRTAEVLAEHGTIERQPLLEGRSMYIVMAPLEKRPEKKTDEAGQPVAAAAGRTGAAAGEPNGATIGEALAAKGQRPPAATPPTTASEAPAQQGS